jgi:hypothetical protein
MAAMIPPRHAVDGCGCVRCRGIDPSILRRSTGGDLRWSIELLRRRPSIPAAVTAFVVAVAALEPILAPFEPTAGWIDAPLHTAVGGVLLVVLLRGYVGAVVASELTDQRSTVRETVVFTARRLVPLAATLLGMMIVGALVFTLALVAVSLLVFDAGVLGPGVFEGVAPTLLFGPVLAVVFYKLWLAPDVAVVGGGGPVVALTRSWAITTAHWRRVAFLLLSFGATVTAPDVLGRALVVTGAEFRFSVPWGEVLVNEFRWLTTSVWYCVGAQIYVRSTLGGPTAS